MPVIKKGANVYRKWNQLVLWICTLNLSCQVKRIIRYKHTVSQVILPRSRLPLKLRLASGIWLSFILSCRHLHLLPYWTPTSSSCCRIEAYPSVTAGFPVQRYLVKSMGIGGLLRTKTTRATGLKPQFIIVYCVFTVLWVCTAVLVYCVLFLPNCEFSHSTSLL